MGVPLWVIVLAVLAASFAHGFCGFGFGILLMAGLSLAGAGLERASVLVTVLAAAVTLTIILGARRTLDVDRVAAALLLGGALVGVPLGYAFVCRFEDAAIGRAAFALVLLAFSAQGLWRPARTFRFPSWCAVPAGVAGGLLGGAFSSSGPPLVLYLYLREDDPRLAKRTLQVVFLGLSAIRVAVVTAGPHGIPFDMLRLLCGLAPLVWAATWSGHRLSRHVSNVTFARVVFVLLGAAGVCQIVRACLLVG